MFLTRIIVSQQLCRSFTRSLYIQGQSPEAKVREYFYYIDHQGMVGLTSAFQIHKRSLSILSDTTKEARNFYEYTRSVL
jgi:hypothetical protein